MTVHDLLDGIDMWVVVAGLVMVKIRALQDENVWQVGPRLDIFHMISGKRYERATDLSA